jgi:hypothetical protein
VRPPRIIVARASGNVDRASPVGPERARARSARSAVAVAGSPSRIDPRCLRTPPRGEPVSGSEFPANREFYKNWAVWRNCTRQNAAESASCRTIPYKIKQGINSRRTGNLLSRAGNLQRLQGIVHHAREFRQICGIMTQPPQDFLAIPSFQCMTDTHVVSALRRKHAEISGHIHDLEKRIARQRANLANLDATISCFRPAQIPMPSLPNGSIARQGILLTMNCPGLRKTPCGQHRGRSRRPE